VSVIVAAVLAGGEGRRIGGRKCERVLLGRSLLDWAVAAAARQAERLAVAARGETPALSRDDVTVLFDDPALAGPLSGLQAALRWAKAEGATWLLTLPCDTPFAPADLAARLREAAAAAEAPAALARSAGVLHPACAVWKAELGHALEDYAASGRASLIGFAESVGYAAADWRASRVDPFFNVNTSEDLAVAERLAKQLRFDRPD
jgi:molybdopterin-guanine dinucleotide biosynthesis protein A